MEAPGKGTIRRDDLNTIVSHRTSATPKGQAENASHVIGPDTDSGIARLIKVIGRIFTGRIKMPIVQ
jgi:hypothetical protein